MKPWIVTAAALVALLGSQAEAQTPAQFFNPVGAGRTPMYRPYYHQGFTPRPNVSHAPRYVGPEQHFDANVGYSSSYYRGPGGEMVKGQNLPPNSRSLGYRYAGSYGPAHPHKGK